MRANIVGPPSVATRIKASIRRLPLRRRMLSLRKLRDVIAGVPQGDELAAAGQRDRFVEPSFPAPEGFIPAIRGLGFTVAWRYPVAIEGKPDMTRISHFGREGPGTDIASRWRWHSPTP
jgi:hypothetical protein